LRDKVEAGKIGRMIAIYVDPADTMIGYVAGNETRDYKNSAINWDVDQWKLNYILRAED
jgi:hypothetical protein